VRKLILCFFLIAIAVNCTTQRPRVSDVPLPSVVNEETPRLEMPVATSIMGPKVWKTPGYSLPKDASFTFKQAVGHIEKHGNSDKFFEFVESKKFQRFTHEPLPVSEALEKFRNCLDRGDTIPVVWKYTIYPSVIGSYSAGKIRENPRKALTAIERAGHLYHETSHKCGFKHVGNDWNKNDNLNSFPYVIGHVFEEYLELQEKMILAGAP